LGGFPKKIRNKTFYFHTKKNILLYRFILSFGPRVHFRGKKLTFWQKKFRQILTTLFISLKVAHSAQGARRHQKKFQLDGLLKS
jgi:hypothetical protein